MHAGFQRVVDQTAVGLERLAQRVGGAVHVLGVAAGHGLLQQHGAGFHGLLGGGALLRVDLGLGGLLRLGHRLAAGGAQFVGPDGHGRQRRGGVLRGGAGLRQRGGEGVPHRGELGLRGFQLRRVAHVHAGPVRIGLQGGGLGAPVGHVGFEAGVLGLGVGPGLGGEQLDALGQQHGGLALHQQALLRVFDRLDALGQAGAQRGQRLARQWRAGAGGIALPGQGVGDIQARSLQQRVALLGPLVRHGVLLAGALDLVELLAQRLGRALVLGGEFLEHLLHLLLRGLAGEPVAQALGALARGGGREHAARERIERVRGGRRRRGGSVGGRVVLGVAGEGKHGGKLNCVR